MTLVSSKLVSMKDMLHAAKKETMRLVSIILTACSGHRLFYKLPKRKKRLSLQLFQTGLWTI